MPSVFTDTGQEWVIDRIDPNVAEVGDMKFVAWGGTATAPVVGNTTLGSEFTGEARVTGTISQPAANQYRVVGEITATADRIVNEAGLFNTAVVAGSVMLIRGTHPTLNIETNDRTEYTFTITVKDSSEA